MIRKSALLAVAATAALGFALLNPTLASAHGHKGHHGHGHHGHHHHGHHHHGHHHHHRRHWHVHYRYRPYYYAARPVISTPGPCTCLSKEYTPQGQVLFKDRCTNEAAINPPLQQQSAVEAPQQSPATYQQQPSNMLPQQPVQ